jgi:hypothetical protein
MPTSESHSGSGHNRRFMDVKDEPLRPMVPIKGYEKMPIVSLEEAVRPLVQIIPDLEQMVYTVKSLCDKSPSGSLSLNQAAAIMLYTLEWELGDGSFYRLLNQTLRNENRKALKPWFLYLKLLLSALELLPSTSRTVFRGVREDLRNQYEVGATVNWWGFGSCTSSIGVLSREEFLGTSGKRTMFTIECLSGRDIHEYSYLKDENEILLPTGRELKVLSVDRHDGDLWMVHLKETQPKYPLLESFPTYSSNGVQYTAASKNFQKHPSSPQPLASFPSKIFHTSRPP